MNLEVRAKNQIARLSVKLIRASSLAVSPHEQEKHNTPGNTGGGRKESRDASHQRKQPT
jgi:hypothetical protein